MGAAIRRQLPLDAVRHRDRAHPRSSDVRQRLERRFCWPRAHVRGAGACESIAGLRSQGVAQSSRLVWEVAMRSALGRACAVLPRRTGCQPWPGHGCPG